MTVIGDGLRIDETPSEYDPNFYGGIDDLIPNDSPEEVDGIACPDHGELWTTALSHRVDCEALRMEGMVRLTQVNYTKRVGLRPNSPEIDLD